MFRHAMGAVAFVSEEKIAAKVEHLKKTFRWEDAEVGIAISKAPNMLNKTKEFLQRSLEGRLRPRSYVVKFLKANGLLDPDRDLYSAVALNEKVFMKKFICPYKEAALHLAQDYAAACRGEVPARFRFT
ncbi:hypothetical protein CFC21_085953 [Triticum aestivum]|uniref:Reverse transcriptase Ty1/copia-type domain-containing protein n=2 Tax=Triticum aestivum TaxID=4565 RepID=A0A9R1L8Z0_WHEAT|nr:hypothetical protein CFC21_085953 [Triticum aestivum]